MRRLTRPIRPPATVSLVSMIDVLMIMLVFFMVTSTFLDLDMLPLVADAAQGGADDAALDGGAMLVRLGADGQVRLRGQVVPPDALADLMRARPGLAVTVLPSGQAPVQALALVMDAATAAGVARLDILRLEGGP
ncbi:MAG: biopolymer transporter ExbD [Gemmobacter sp.]|nr:biopolymer transporter ExbD [Gemmobacter sp.]